MLLLAAASLTVSCSREKSGFGMEDLTPEGVSGTAYLDLAGGLSVTVHKAGEVVNTHEGDEATATRSVGEDDECDNYTVEIIARKEYKDNVVKYDTTRYTYGEIKALTTPIALSVGWYNIRVYSAKMKPTAWEGDAGQPTFSGETGFFELKVENSANEPYQPGTIVCKLESIQVSVSLEEELAVLCSNTSVKVGIENKTVSDRVITFSDSDKPTEEKYCFGIVDLEVNNSDFTLTGTQRTSKNAYLAPVEEENELIATFTTEIEGSEIEKNILITSEAKAGEWHKVTLYLKSGPADNTGSIAIGATVETWVYNQLVEVKSLSTDFDEEVIPDINDPNAPRIIPRNKCFLVSDTNHITAAHYTNVGDYNKTALIDITTTTNIKRFAVRILTDNDAFNTYLESSGLNTVVDLLSTDASQLDQRNRLHLMGFPRGVAIQDGGLEQSIDLTSFMTFLAPYSGYHELTIAVTDEKGLYSRIDLDLNIDLTSGSASAPKDGSPTIVWVGNNIDARQEVYAGLSCEVEVEAPKGIAEFIVDISGEITPLLGDFAIPTHFSLINPEESQISGAELDLNTVLGNFGFPVGDKVKGKTFISFDISQFMELIKGSCPTGNVDFRLTVTDNEGNETSKAIMLHTVLEE